MRRLGLILAVVFSVALTAVAKNVTLAVTNRPATDVFSEIMAQTGKNFVYRSDLLTGMKVTLTVRNEPLKKVLKKMFDGTDVEFVIKGKDVILKRRAPRATVRETSARPVPAVVNVADPQILDEVVVISRLEAPAVTTAEMGGSKLTSKDVLTTPALFGEADVIKTIQNLPGVTEGTEGMAGMMVHGGGPDQNLYLLDNVTLYQVNHFGGFFSAFNVDAIRYVDFFKTSLPARYDGRLSSVLDVKTSGGRFDGHHGSGRLGLTSGAFNIAGPIGSRTTYMAAVRRSWFDILTVPLMAIVNAASTDEKTKLRYDFTDLNIGVSHRFTDRTTGSLSVYYGEDALVTGWKSWGYADYSLNDNEKGKLRWGNLMARAGVVHRFTPTLSAEFTAAFTRYFSTMKSDNRTEEMIRDSLVNMTRQKVESANNINDGIVRADLTWRPDGRSTVRFGAGYTLHSFLPSRISRENTSGSETVFATDSGCRYPAGEFNVYIEDDWRVTDRLRVNAGLHGTLFRIDRRTKGAVSPRLSLSYRFDEQWAVKAAYTRTAQFVHHLAWSYISLPTDQWVPVTGDFKPQTADKIAAGVYWQSADGAFTASVEGYLKKMNNIIEYRDEYYLTPPLDLWNSRLTSGYGTAKGIDFKIEKTIGKFTGHVSYSLSKTDRTFAEKNNGKTYLARYDQPHSINVVVKWQISPKVALNAAWIGHSGNRFTLMTDSWEGPEITDRFTETPPLRVPVNNYRLPFYHRLDLGLTVRNSRGYWSFGLYNAYNHLNTIAIRRGDRDGHLVNSSGYWSWSRPVFQKVCLLPLIPSISYTWEF